MKRVDAALQLQQWFAEHASTVRSMLRRFGVSEKEDRANLMQDVPLTAYRALLRGDVIENPRAWLIECARKQASNYRRKAQRQTPVDDRRTRAVPAESGMVTEKTIDKMNEFLRGEVSAVETYDLALGKTKHTELVSSLQLAETDIDDAAYKSFVSTVLLPAEQKSHDACRTLKRFAKAATT